MTALGYASAPVREPHDEADRDIAISSVFCGLLIFAPLIPALMSLAFGISVLRHARRVRQSDFALAVIGTTLGALNLMAWAAFLLLGFLD